MVVVRVIISIFPDIKTANATGEAMLRARLINPNLPPTLLFSKIASPSMIFHADMPSETVDLNKCEKKGITLCRDIATFSSETDYQADYRDKDSWEFHVLGSFSDFPIFEQYNLIPINFLAEMGLKAFVDVNDVIVGGRVIGCSTFTANKFLWWNGSLFQDLPNIDDLYISPRRLPSKTFTTLKRELGRYISDEELISGIKKSFTQLFNYDLEQGELTTLEKDLFKKALPKYVEDTRFILQGDKLSEKTKLYRKCIDRLTNYLTLHGVQSDYLRPVTRYCPQLCSAYAQCIAQTVPAKTIKDQLDFCKKQAQELPPDLLEATEIVS